MLAIGTGSDVPLFLDWGEVVSGEANTRPLQVEFGDRHSQHVLVEDSISLPDG